MDDNLKAWIIKMHERLRGRRREIFLKLLGSRPDVMSQIIRDNLVGWNVSAMREQRTSIDCSTDDCQEILEALKKHFAGEIPSPTK